MLPVVLGSTSPFRAKLLQKLEIPFTTAAPDIDETQLPAETPAALVMRLTEAKAKKVAESHPAHLIIASDQTAIFDGEPIGKPGNHENAVNQLRQFSGHTVTFFTGLALYNSDLEHLQISIEPFHVSFKILTATQIEHYLRRETPYNCAGSFKSEGLGITLFRKFEGEDPNTLIGLPLIRLTEYLAKEGIELPLAPD